MRTTWMAILFAFAVACGGGDGNGENNQTNGGTNSNTTPVGECSTDDDCPGASTATFADASLVKCVSSTFRGAYCSECANQFQCDPGYACRDATYCEELPECNVGSDCASAGSEAHKACIARFCDFCVDDADCADDEACYSKLCVTRDKIAPTCADLSCEGICEIAQGDDGVATGVECVE